MIFRRHLILITLVGLFTLSACKKNTSVTIDNPNAGDDVPANIQTGIDQNPSQEPLTAKEIAIKPVGNSAVTGAAQLNEVDGQAMISLTLNDKTLSASTSANLHLGTCENVGELAGSLSPIVNGQSETLLDRPLQGIQELGDLSIVITYPGDPSNRIACVEIK